MTYLHIKRDSLYDVMGRLTLQTDTPLLDNAPLIVYRARSDGALWGRSPEEFFHASRFRPVGRMTVIGDKVSKATGYPFPGEVRSVFFNRAGERRMVIEATGREYAGMLHIFNPSQLISVAGEPL